MDPALSDKLEEIEGVMEYLNEKSVKMEESLRGKYMQLGREQERRVEEVKEVMGRAERELEKWK